MNSNPLLIATVVVSIAFSSSTFGQTEAAGIAFFEQKIRPVLVQQCYSCHSAEAVKNKKLKGGLLLDSKPALLKGGDTGPAIVVGKPAESLLLKALNYDGFEMPPQGKLAANVIADFSKWIEMGAPDPRQDASGLVAKREINLDEGRKFWSFQPLPTSVSVPDVPASVAGTNPIDRFIVSKQLAAGVKPNGPADKIRLLRRVYFDLVGLPPTPEQLAAFLADSSPDAFEKVVDGLLASPAYGERWARHWLDVTRFAESGGYEFDGFRPGAYHYRDWVIRALNADMPYDEFLRMQLAGDKLASDEYQGASAVGFLVAGPYPGQITAKTVERIRYDQLDDMLMTMGGSMLGLTIGCVRCHEHKYDPIPQADYYGLAASLAKSVQGSKRYDLDPQATVKALESHQATRAKLVADLQTFAKTDLPARFAEWQKTALPQQPDASRWQTLEPFAFEAERSYLKVQAGGLILHDGNLSQGAGPITRGRGRGARVPMDAEEYSITTRSYQKEIVAIRLDALTDKSLPRRGPGLNNDGGFQLMELKLTAKPLNPTSADKPIEVKLKPVFAAFEDANQPVANAVDGKPNTGWLVKATAGKDNAAIFEVDGKPLGFAGGTEFVFELKFKDVGLGRFRLSVSTEPNPATWAGESQPQHIAEIRALLAANKNTVPEALRPDLAVWFSRFDPATEKVVDALRQHDNKVPRPAYSEVYTTVAGGQDVFLLRRGEVDNKAGKAEPGFIQVLHRAAVSTSPDTKPATPSTTTPTTAANTDPRVRLAEWITNPERGAGALVARVMANRVWQHHFGKGIVGTPNDFGAQGDRPTHPELLEWLARELVSNGWKIKSLHKTILLSRTYQQSHLTNPENLKADPTNKLHWHFRPQRLEAESLRDALLVVGGNLDAKMYGPSVLDNTTRRSVYLRVKRSELIPMMTMFDAPEPTQSIGERVSTTVPTQALAMMNSPFVRQTAERLAKRVRPTAETSLETAIDTAYKTALSRSPTADELKLMRSFIDQQQTLAGGKAPDSTDRAVTEFCHVLLCLSEFMYVD